MEPFDEHDRDVDPAVLRFLYSRPEPVEIGLIEAREVELWKPIGRVARSRAQPRLGRLVPRASVLEVVVHLRQALCPQPEEVVAVARQEIQIGVVVKNWRW